MSFVSIEVFIVQFLFWSAICYLLFLSISLIFLPAICHLLFLTLSLIAPIDLTFCTRSIHTNWFFRLIPDMYGRKKNKNPHIWGVKSGPEGTRTPDLLSAIEARSQLRYRPSFLDARALYLMERWLSRRRQARSRSFVSIEAYVVQFLFWLAICYLLILIFSHLFWLAICDLIILTIFSYP